MKDRVYEAMRFAIEHYGKAGFGYDGNYFFPPTEMMSILNTMNMAEMNQEVMIAGILYNTVEDTDATIDMIEERFEPDVAALVRRQWNEYVKMIEEAEAQGIML